MTDLWPFRPDLGCTETLEFNTEVLGSRTGEQRLSLRSAPRQSFSYSHRLLDEQQFARAREFARRNSAVPVSVPVWGEQTAYGVIDAGVSVLAFDTTTGDWRVGAQLVIWEDDQNYVVRTISVVGASYIGLTAIVGQSFSAAVVCPVRSALTTEGLDIVRGQVHSDVTMTFRVIDNIDLAARYSSAYPQYGGVDVITDAPKLVVDVSENIIRAAEYVDSGAGPIAVEIDHNYADFGQTLVFYDERPDLWRRRLWLHSLRGKQKIFWVPTFNRDLNLQVPVASNSTTLSVESIGPTSSYVGRHIMVERRDGGRYFRQITDAAAIGGGVDNLTISSALGLTLSPADVNMISYLSLDRLDSDSVDIQHNYELCSVVSIPVMEARDTISTQDSEVPPQDLQYLYSDDTGLWGSNDGVTWVHNPGVAPLMRRVLAFGDGVWVGVQGANYNGFMYRSTNGTITWKPIPVPADAYSAFWQVAYMKPAGAATGIFAGLGYSNDAYRLTRVYISHDLGLTWTMSLEVPSDEGDDSWSDYCLTGCGGRLFLTREFYRDEPVPPGTLYGYVRIHTFDGTGWTYSDVFGDFDFESIRGDVAVDTPYNFSLSPGGVGFDNVTGTYGVGASALGDLNAAIYSTSSDGIHWGTYNEVMRTEIQPSGYNQGLSIDGVVAGGDGLLFAGMWSNQLWVGGARNWTWVVNIVSGAYSLLEYNPTGSPQSGLDPVVFNEGKGFAAILGHSRVAHRNATDGGWTVTHTGSGSVCGLGVGQVIFGARTHLDFVANQYIAGGGAHPIGDLLTGVDTAKISASGMRMDDGYATDAKGVLFDDLASALTIGCTMVFEIYCTAEPVGPLIFFLDDPVAFSATNHQYLELSLRGIPFGKVEYYDLAQVETGGHVFTGVTSGITRIAATASLDIGGSWQYAVSVNGQTAVSDTAPYSGRTRNTVRIPMFSDSSQDWYFANGTTYIRTFDLYPAQPPAALPGLSALP